MSRLHADGPPPAPTPPPGVERKPVAFADALEPARVEWFLVGTASQTIAAHAPARQTPGIAYPGQDSILVVDPDIPAAHQRVFFRMRPARSDLRWSLNGQALPADAAWHPQPGSYTLALVDGAQTVLDTVRFTVRGRIQQD